jgi:hypothetical protein
MVLHKTPKYGGGAVVLTFVWYRFVVYAIFTQEKEEDDAIFFTQEKEEDDAIFFSSGIRICPIKEYRCSKSHPPTHT